MCDIFDANLCLFLHLSLNKSNNEGKSPPKATLCVRDIKEREKIQKIIYCDQKVGLNRKQHSEEEVGREKNEQMNGNHHVHQKSTNESSLLMQI